MFPVVLISIYIVIQAYYWATSEWTALQIEEAWRTC